jgi:tRNA(Ile)-lysidine synthase
MCFANFFIMPSFSPELLPELLLARLAGFPDAKIGWVAYSGGVDSSVLLDCLVAARNRLPFEIRALHVHHGLHPDADAWSEHCACECRRLGVPLEIRRVEVSRTRGESLEALARQARYEAMSAVLGRGDLLLSAQHRDDQAETLLLALMRGSGPAGLAAMPFVALLGEGWLVRPLLEHGRAELRAYAEGRNLRWQEDPGNRSLRFDRNFLRHRVLPLLAERWPSCAASIARSAANCAEAQGVIDVLVEEKLSGVAGRWPDALSISLLGDLPVPFRKLVLRHWFRKLGLALPDSRRLDRILCDVIGARPDADPLVAWPGCEVRRYRDDLFAMAPLPSRPPAGPIHWGRGVLSLPGAVGCLELLAPDGSPLDPLDLFATGLEVRFRVKGLFCRTVRDRHRRPLKKLYQEAGVPPWIRPHVPLVFVEGNLLAVADIRTCHSDAPVGRRQFRLRWRSEMCERLRIGREEAVGSDTSRF